MPLFVHIRFLLQRNLRYTTLVTTALELGRKPLVEDSHSLLIRDKASRQHQDITIVVLACEMRYFGQPAERCAHLGVLVQCDSHALARAADTHSAWKFAIFESLRHRVSIVGIVATLLRMATEVEHLKALCREVARQELLQVVACVVASDTDFFHILIFYFVNTFPTTNIRII